jgi:hypothetical protein
MGSERVREIAQSASPRVIAWFSCGASSAVAAALAVGRWPLQTQIVYCDTIATEHPDNERFLADVERWLDRPIQRIKSDKFQTIDEVFEQTRYMAGIAGARCTVEMKKVPRFNFQKPDDIHVFGLTVEEGLRIKRMEETNPELTFEWNLRDQVITKGQCLRLLTEAGIKLPRMYELGFEHNNCLGCVKATSPAYWQRTARLFPDVFARRAKQSREIGARLVRVFGKRMFLDEMELDAGYPVGDGEIDCGPLCLRDVAPPKESSDGK